MITECPVCHNQDLEFKQGTAKTGRNIGKPYKAQFCKPCGKMYFDNPPKAPNGNSQIGGKGEKSQVEYLLGQILKELKIMNGNEIYDVNKEQKIEEAENPF